MRRIIHQKIARRVIKIQLVEFFDDRLCSRYYRQLTESRSR